MPWEFVSLVAEKLLAWTQEGFVGIHDAYYISVDTGQKFFVQLRVMVGDPLSMGTTLLGDVPL